MKSKPEKKPKPERSCIVCELVGATLCRECQRDYDEAIKQNGSIMAIIRWAADRARAAERKRAEKLTDAALKKWGAAMELLNSFDALLESEIGDKLTRLDAACRVMRRLGAAQKKGTSSGERR